MIHENVKEFLLVVVAAAVVDVAVAAAVGVPGAGCIRAAQIREG